MRAGLIDKNQHFLIEIMERTNNSLEILSASEIDFSIEWQDDYRDVKGSYGKETEIIVL